MAHSAETAPSDPAPGSSPGAACPLCASTAVTPWARVGRYPLSRCTHCTHLFVSGGLAISELDTAYERSYYVADPGSARQGYEDYLATAGRRTIGFEQRLREVEKVAPGRGRLLDFGCAIGLFVRVAQDAGWDAYGYERSAWAAELGRREFGVRIEQGSGSGGLPFAEPFDVVTIWDALEHLESPREILQRIAGCLRPGGLLVLNTIDASSLGARLAGEHWRHIAPPHHLQYYTRRSLRGVLEASGFRVTRVSGQGVLLGADRRRASMGSVYRGIEWVCTHWRMRPLANAWSMLDEVELTAVRI